MSILNWFSGQPVFDQATDMPPLKDKVILVTGGTSGLGKQAVIEYARHRPAKLWLAARNTTRAEAVINEIKAEIPDASIEFLQLDLTSFDSIREASVIFQSKSQRLDILMLNAGISTTPCGLTKEGYEIQFGTNYLSGALLSKLLLPTLLSTTKLSGADVRVVYLGSEVATMAPTGGILFDSVKTEQQEINTWARYGQSKLAVILQARELADRYPELNVTSVHPGFVDTNWAEPLKNSSLFWVIYPAMRSFSVGVEQGVRNQMWASVSPSVQSGTYYLPIGKTSPMKFDTDLQKRLWEWKELEFSGLD